MRESRIQRALIVGIAALGGCAEKFSSPAKRFVPDLLVSWPQGSGNAAWFNDNLAASVEFIECKAPGGRLAAGQLRDHERRRAMGFEVHVIWNMEQVETYLKARGKK